ncbi:MAG: isoaspartyl peptidase/L-asparaginase family protein [Balneolaceae bacterium]
MISRNRFIKTISLGGLFPFSKALHLTPSDSKKASPIVLSTWSFGVEANRVAWDVIEKGGTALDAVEAGVKIPEADPENYSVGYGGFPDREGRGTLDACVMDHKSRCGSVVFLEHIKHPVSVARKVMEETPHIMLAGEGALQFALEQGFKKENLLTEKARQKWEEWKIESNYRPIPNIENHDTIGMLAIDTDGNLSGACSTSGLAFKMNGRVGDSPLIGSGLFVDNEAGAATATGHGEEIIRIAGSHLVVELMRQGVSPKDACREAVKRIIKNNDDMSDIQCAFLALNRQGEYGAFAVQQGFNFAVTGADGHRLIDSDYEL